MPKSPNSLSIGRQFGTIKIEHQLAAEAVVDYCERSAKWIFGVLTGNRLADRVIRALRRAGDKGISRTDITNRVLGKNYSAAVVTEILTEVRKEGYGLAKFRRRNLSFATLICYKFATVIL